MLTGGAQKVLLIYAEYLIKVGHSVTIVSLKKELKYKINRDITYIELLPMNHKITCNIFFILQELSYVSKESDIIISFGSLISKYLVFTLGNLYKKPILICIRNSLKEEIINHKETSSVNYDLIKQICQFSPIMVQSYNVKEAIIRDFNIDNKNIYVIANHINKKIIKDNPSSIEINDFIVVGRLCKEKNNQLILKAFALLPIELRETIKIHFIGEGELKKSLIDLCKILNIYDNIIFHGYIDNPLPLIKKAKCLIIASLTEGMPNVILEAWSQNTLVLASDIEPIKALVEDKKTGLLFQSENKKDLSEMILYVINNNLKILIENGYKNLKHYECMDKKFEQLLQNIIKYYKKEIQR